MIYRRLSGRAYLTCLVGLCVSLSAQAERSPSQLLESMDRAVRELDYSATLIYFNGKDLSSFRYVHAVVDEVEHERLVHLSGHYREMVRIGTRSVTLSDPNGEAVEYSDDASSGPLSAFFTRHFDEMDQSYDLKVVGNNRVAGLDAVGLRIQARDANRYSYLLWLDDDTNLLLRLEMRSTEDAPLEIFEFVDVQVGAVDLSEFELLEQNVKMKLLGQARSLSGVESPQTAAERDVPWRVDWVPVGFQRSSAEYANDHCSMMYTDGLAAFSLYIEEVSDAGDEPLEVQNGATVVVRTKTDEGPDSDGHMVTVVGEVPVETARKIARAVNYRQ